jgi:lysophospholipase L1-like esterase
MRRVGSVALVLLAIAVFAAAGYVVVHRTRVADAGVTPALPSVTTSATPSVTLTTSPAAGTPTPSGSGSTAPPTPPLVAFLGDDWTAGAGASPTSKRFTTLVCARLGLRELNYGLRGSGYAKQGRSGGDYASQVPNIVAARPAMVVVTGGRNDVGEDPSFAGGQAHRLIEKLRSRLPRASIVIVAPMWGDSAEPSTLRKLATNLKRDAAAVGATYLNLPDPIRGHPNEIATAARPNDAGYAAIARALEPKLAPLAAALRSSASG